MVGSHRLGFFLKVRPPEPNEDISPTPHGSTTSLWWMRGKLSCGLPSQAVRLEVTTSLRDKKQNSRILKIRKKPTFGDAWNYAGGSPSQAVREREKGCFGDTWNYVRVVSSRAIGRWLRNSERRFRTQESYKVPNAKEFQGPQQGGGMLQTWKGIYIFLHSMSRFCPPARLAGRCVT